MAPRSPKPAAKPAAGKRAAAKPKAPKGAKGAARPAKPKAAAPATPVDGSRIDVTLGEIRASPLNPRTIHDEAAALDLRASIRSQGLLQPLLARWNPAPAWNQGPWELIAGERRWRAILALAADDLWPLDKPIPIIVRQMTDEQLLDAAWAENDKRKGMHPLDEAAHFARYQQPPYELTAPEIAERLGTSVRTIWRRLALLNLPEHAAEALRLGEIDLSQAEAILAQARAPAAPQPAEAQPAEPGTGGGAAPPTRPGESDDMDPPEPPAGAQRQPAAAPLLPGFAIPIALRTMTRAMIGAIHDADAGCALLITALMVPGVLDGIAPPVGADGVPVPDLVAAWRGDPALQTGDVGRSIDIALDPLLTPAERAMRIFLEVDGCHPADLARIAGALAGWRYVVSAERIAQPCGVDPLSRSLAGHLMPTPDAMARHLGSIPPAYVAALDEPAVRRLAATTGEATGGGPGSGMERAALAPVDELRQRLAGQAIDAGSIPPEFSFLGADELLSELVFAQQVMATYLHQDDAA